MKRKTFIKTLACASLVGIPALGKAKEERMPVYGYFRSKSGLVQEKIKPVMAKVEAYLHSLDNVKNVVIDCNYTPCGFDEDCILVKFEATRSWLNKDLSVNEEVRSEYASINYNTMLMTQEMLRT
ncbi:MAG: hypothetical protein ABIG30_00820 [Candidatus Aenigmatarchaeota archaeon]